jgi:dTMP kinase
MKSKAFVFEGLDFTGKTTVSQYCFEKLKMLYGPGVVLYRSPGGTPLGEKVRDIARIEAKTVYEQTFAYLTGLTSVLEQVEKDLEKGKIVLLDRWFQSLQAYQILQITDDGIRTALNTAATLLANKAPYLYSFKKK